MTVLPHPPTQQRSQTTIQVAGEGNLEAAVPAEALDRALTLGQRGFPAIAKDASLMGVVERAVARLGSKHAIWLGDARRLAAIPDESVHLVLTSPPYWTLKEYEHADGQLAEIEDYEGFLRELDRSWAEAMRILVPGGRLIVVVGDVCLPRRQFGRHVVFPLHASITEHCRALGFDNLSPIFWHKIANAQFEMGPGGTLGKPYEPNGVIKNDVEYILFQRKPGGYRNPSDAARILSLVSAERHREWFQQIWSLPGASTRDHPAPFPLPLAERLVRMFSFVGDTVVDPFTGTGTTNIASALWGRNSVGLDAVEDYADMAASRLLDLQVKRAQAPLGV